jgi:WD40 repeat protein
MEVVNTHNIVDVNNLLVTCKDGDAALNLWDAHTHAPVGTLTWEGHTSAGVRRLVFSWDNTLLATGDIDGLITVWDIKCMRQIVRFKLADPVRGICISRSIDGLVALTHQQISSWNLSTHQRKYEIPLSGINDFEGLHLTLDDSKIVVLVENVIRIWDFGSGTPVGDIIVATNVTSPGSSIATSPIDPDEIVSVLSHGEVIVSYMAAPNKKWSTSIVPSVPTEFCYSHDGTRLFIGTRENELIILDLNSKQVCWSFQLENELHFFALSPDGSKIACGIGINDTVVFDLDSRAIITTLQGESGSVVRYSRASSVILM